MKTQAKTQFTRTMTGLMVLLVTACLPAVAQASSLNPLEVALVQEQGNRYFEPVGRRLTITMLPARLFVRLRNVSEDGLRIRISPELAYSIELTDSDRRVTVIKRKPQGKNENDRDDVRVPLAAKSDRIVPIEIDPDTWEGLPTLKPNEEQTFSARIIYVNADGRSVYSESYTLVFQIGM